VFPKANPTADADDDTSEEVQTRTGLAQAASAT
jgi:hypothetical protein